MSFDVDKALENLFELATYCPICAKKLEVEERAIGQGRYFSTFTVKACADGHGEMNSSICSELDSPVLEFEVPKEISSG